jgi:hypothetical protein
VKRGKLGAFASVVALVVGYAVYDYRSSQTETQVQSEQKLLLKADADQVQKISVSSNGHDIELEKDINGWKMTKPVVDSANSNLIEQFIEGIVTEKAQDTAAEGDKVDLSAYGLDQPKGVIQVTLNSGQSTKFAIGKVKNFQGDAYLQKNDEKKVWIVSSTWFSKIEKTPLDFRDKRVMRRSNAGTEKITVEKGKDQFQLIKKDGQWVSVQRPDWKLDQNKVRELLAEMNTTEALEFIAEGDARPEELKKWGLQQPPVRLILQTSSDPKVKPWVADFAAGSDKVYRLHTSDPSLVMKISPTDFGKFQALKLDQFRDRTEPFYFDRAKVRQIEIKLGKDTIHLKADEAKAKELFNQFDKLKVVEFTELRDEKLDQEISFQDESGHALFSLQWGALHAIPGPMGDQKVFAAKTTTFPKGFTVSEMDISLLNLKELNKKESAP